ncbi:hypothetical protein ACFLRY_04885, partial [Bacteroidota bacterium]
ESKLLAMRRISLCILLSLFSLAIIAQQNASNDYEKLWESEEVFQVPESVYCDNDNNILYVSNINGSAVVKDDNGFISKLGKDGKVVELKWVDGLNAPKGMGKYGDLLYVADIDELIEIDIPSGKVLNRFKVEGARFLNDIAIDPNGIVYISDTQNNMIYIFDGNAVEEWYTNEDFIGLNGLFYHGNALYAGSRDMILKINTINKASKVAAENMGPVDGLNIDEYYNYIVSDFSGKVQYLKPDGEFYVLFNTSDQLMNAADIYYDIESGILYVPTFIDNRVMAYRIN